MRRTLLLSLFVTALIPLTALSVSTAQAQIEVGQNGYVGVQTDPSRVSALRVRCGEDCAYNGSYTYGYGAHVSSSGKSRNRGLYGSASVGPNNSNSYVANYGVLGRASGEANRNYGIYGQALGASDVGYGVYGYASGAATRYAGYFSGNVHVTGSITEASDAMFKRDVEALGEGDGEAPSAPAATQAFAGAPALRSGQAGGDAPLSNAREKLLQLRPVKYEYRQDAYEHMGFPEGEHFGFVAQEVEAVLPELVTEAVHPGTEEIGEDGEIIQEGEPLRYKSVSYIELVPLLVQTAKEQQAEIEALRAEVEALQDLVEDDD